MVLSQGRLRATPQGMNVLTIQSRVAHGHVGNSAATLPLHRLGHEVWAVDTVCLAHHPGHGHPAGRVVPAAEVAALVAGLGERGCLDRVDALITGYLGDPANAAGIGRIAERVRPRGWWCCDPVMGDAGRVFVDPALVPAFRDELVPRADLVTPNVFELGLLTGCPVNDPPEIVAAARQLAACGPAVVVTGIEMDANRIACLAVAESRVWRVVNPRHDGPRNGGGDLFTALLVGQFLSAGRRPPSGLPSATARAAAGVAAVMARSVGADDLRLVAAQHAAIAPGNVPVAEEWS